MRNTDDEEKTWPTADYSDMKALKKVYNENFYYIAWWESIYARNIPPDGSIHSGSSGLPFYQYSWMMTVTVMMVAGSYAWQYSQFLVCDSTNLIICWCVDELPFFSN